MRPEERDAAYLQDMLVSATAVVRHTGAVDRDEYLKNELLRGWVERQVEIIGEAAGHISRSFRDAHPEIPWRRIIAQRHVIVHNYGAVDHERLWRVASVHIPELIELLRPLVPPPPPDSMPT